VPPKRRFTQDLHGATFQKTAFFIIIFAANIIMSRIKRKLKQITNIPNMLK
jgi:hypothetical protein